MERESLEKVEKHNSDDSLDRLIRQFDISSPWNRGFAGNVYQIHSVVVSDAIVDDIIETTCGHPGFSMWWLPNQSSEPPAMNA